MDRTNFRGAPARPAYRVRTPDTAGRTPPGVHLAGVGRSGAAHGRPRSRTLGVAVGVATTLAIFLLALLLVTGIEVVVGEPLSGGAAGHTSLGDVLHPSS